MTKAEKSLAIVRAARERGIGYKRLAKLLRCSRTSAQRFAHGKFPATSQLRSALVDRVLELQHQFDPKKARVRAVRPLQMRKVDPKRHALVKEKCERLGYVICSVWWMTPPDELKGYVTSRSARPCDEFLAKLDKFDIPHLELSEEFIRSLFHQTERKTP